MVAALFSLASSIHETIVIDLQEEIQSQMAEVSVLCIQCRQ